MNDDEIIKGHKYLFLDWYRQKLGHLAPIVKVKVVKIIPRRRVNGLLHATSYEAVDDKGIIHYGSAGSFRPLKWIDDRE